MSHPHFIALVTASAAFLLPAKSSANDGNNHRTHAEELAESQDNLSADVQKLVLEQTHPQVIELLSQVEDIMDEVVEKLAVADTGGDTLAAQTEIIEKIYEAAKQKQQQGGSGKSGGAMMDMMERMMGKKEEGKTPGGKDGKEDGQQGGQGSTGDSDSGNQPNHGNTSGPREIRRVPKASGTSGTDIPSEFRKAFDAYNRGLEDNIR